jgi:hypothetical protein
MLTNLVRRGLAAAAILFASALASSGAASASTTMPYCGITWGSLEKDGGTLSRGALVDVRTGHHDCYDRVVFDLQGSAGGYRAGYAGRVGSQGRGEPLDVVGGAQIAVELLEPAYDAQTGVPTVPYAVGDHPFDISVRDGYRTLTDVVYGGTFEGYTTFGIGVRARLPFRVLTLPGTGTSSRIVIDVAHQWSR